MMELQLGLALCSNSAKGCNFDDIKIESLSGNFKLNNIKKCSSSQVFDVVDENVQVLQTLPLLVWDKVNEHDERKDGDEEGVVGWPPVNSLRKKLCHQNRRAGGAMNYVTVENGGGGSGSGGGGRRSNSKYVKVKMEGVGIARKIDLSLFQSYGTLTDTLIAMFGKSKENGDAYELTYQDKEGDWLLAGDVPWRTFVGSVQRLKLVRDEDY
ncbi:PREDICTED: auxin-responsive protein IAA29-like [Nicotiana attenuata]|uniref:Auxin-responsive protein n=1 Tax=Nicotiana attenuata TaxID=49451 RepID=A0A1J6ILQ5_NICAT|nr:PREDICTED: auxin-responsive protein IAA29-like [Nicotiana attenuata]OIT01448.1 auxin-responsive protein iaa29 [Nicotiana attenuata]